MLTNPFVYEPSRYARDYDFLGAYVNQNAHYLTRMADRPMADMVAFVRKTVSKNGALPIQDKPCLVLEQVSPGNRVREDRTFFQFLKDVVMEDLVLSPSMVAYLPASVKRSISAQFISHGIDSRKKSKKESAQAKIDGLEVLSYIKDCEQNAKKIDINSLSGMLGFAGNILYQKSGHPTLTSMCRSATGYGNASNERFISGNRHYHDPLIVIGHIATICTRTDFELLESAMTMYNLHYPTPAEAMECVRHSTSLYFSGEEPMVEIEQYLTKLTELERAAFVYAGDLYHLMKFNSDFVRKIFADLLTPAATPVANPADILGKIDSDKTSFVNQRCATIMRDSDQKKVAASNPEGYQQLAQVAQGLEDWLLKYELLIHGLWRTDHLPPSVANIKSIVRDTVLASDTDSTIFSVQDWVQWYTGTYAHTEDGDGVWFGVTYLATQVIVHELAKLSANLGVETKNLHRLAMKNEYSFPVFSQTSMAKHYYAFQSTREGNVFGEYEMEQKGVYLRSSTIPPDIIAGSKNLQKRIMHTVDAGEKVSLEEVYREIYNWEIGIAESIRKGESTYLKTLEIKATYKNPESSALVHYHLWQEVFAPKYGTVAAPPYRAVKVPVEIDNKTAMQAWIAAIKDREIATRLETFMRKRNRETLTMLLLPENLLEQNGMPEEVLPVLNTRKLTYELLISYYMTLESLGVYQVDEDYNRLVQDVYSPGTQTIVAVTQSPATA